MKKKPMLLKAIREEKAKLDKQLKIIKKNNSKDKIEIESKLSKKDDSQKTIQNKKKEMIHKKKSNSIKYIFDFILKIITLIINLIISIFDSFQWLFMSIILTISAIIILNYLGIDTKDITNAISELIKK